MDKKIPTEAHTITNEDGKQFQHSGYTSRTCLKCGGEFVVAKDVAEQYNVCPFCEDKEKKPIKDCWSK